MGKGKLYTVLSIVFFTLAMLFGVVGSVAAFITGGIAMGILLAVLGLVDLFSDLSMIALLFESKLNE